MVELKQIFLSDIEKSKLIKINNSGRTSHFNWIAKNKLVVYGGLPNKFNKLRKKQIFSINTRCKNDIKILSFIN